MSTEIQDISAEAHNWPHIPTLQGEVIPWWDFSVLWIDFHITNTVLSTWIFILILLVIAFLFNRALKKKSSVLKSTGIWLVSTIRKFSFDFMGNEKFSNKILFLTWWLFLFVVLANIYWLVIDWLLLVAGPNLHLTEYLRPINSDPNTTFAMSLTVVLLSHGVMLKTRWVGHYLKGYLFDFRGKWMEKFVNVFVGWLHFISEFIKILSLALRLFGNIFAWIILISVIAFLWGMISFAWISFWEILVLPFWFFELFVAFIQAVVFFILPSVYFAQALELEH